MKYALLMLFVVIAGCQKSTPNTFQLNVEAGSLADPSQQESKLTFKTPPNAKVTVETESEKQLVTVDELNSDGMFTVTLSVTREKSELEGKSRFRTLIRPKLPMEHTPVGHQPTQKTVHLA